MSELPRIDFNVLQGAQQSQNIVKNAVNLVNDVQALLDVEYCIFCLILNAEKHIHGPNACPQRLGRCFRCADFHSTKKCPVQYPQIHGGVCFKCCLPMQALGIALPIENGIPSEVYSV